MYGAVIHAPGDVRYEERDEPTIIDPTDAVVRTVAACVCGSDLWRYRGIAPVPRPTPIGHEFCGVVERVGGWHGLGSSHRANGPDCASHWAGW